MTWRQTAIQSPPSSSGRRALGRDIKDRISPALQAAGILSALIDGVGRWIAIARYIAPATLLPVRT